MSVTFFPAPPAGGRVELGASIECPAYPPTGRRYFADYDAAVAGLLQAHDDAWGGFGQAPKFPQPASV